MGSTFFAETATDFVAAWMLGVAFHYFAIKPMRQLSTGEAIKDAIKADTLSIVAFQSGMYAGMALAAPHRKIGEVWQPLPLGKGCAC